MVCSPSYAFKFFVAAKMNFLEVGKCVLYREGHDDSLNKKYRERYEVD